ncbi:AsnC family transcriptional regulator [Novosphingobium sp. PC22D]|uniref:Lrp/AsnC family transcriptional regulator n=1 Tax=Novosphingobium sp. PC22D TaxID=1962403 RepID=UPI000BEFA928|nr:Lrp/AsnC family transcriptional regulator [Novosphingobium sp. PC22D]PEQ10558.1 AsnC family transcriptional regulator [Novosphingobium sp. PC22D]
MDDVDLRILREIQANPELPLTELAPVVGLSQTPCWRRIKKLEQQGVIKGRTVMLDPAALGLTVNVFAHIRLTSHREETLEALERAVEEHPEIIECFSMSGESDYMLRILSPSIEAYEHYLKRKLSHLPGIASINSSFALKCVKDTRMLPF